MSGVFSIHKYPLSIGSSVELDLPVGSQVLHLGHQDGVPMVWIRVPVDVGLSSEDRTFVCMGTGWSMAEDASQHHYHIGTVQIESMVWHFFERLKRVVPMQFANQQAWGGVHSMPVNSQTPT
jgi:hypothetical protein